MFRDQGAVLISVFQRPGLWNSICLVRCRSTKSAIHAALTRSEHRDERLNRDPTRPHDRHISRHEHRPGNFKERIRPPAFRTSDYSDERLNNVPARNGQRLGRVTYNGQKGDDFRYSEEKKYCPPERHAGLSLMSFPPKEMTPKTAEYKPIRGRSLLHREGQFEPRGPTEIDFTGVGKYAGIRRTRQQNHEDPEPLTLPYTTPASEFLYGHNVVTAALRARRRKLYKMYIYQSPKREDERRDINMRKMALDRGVSVEMVPADGLRMLDRMSEGRPHNVSCE